MTRRRTLPRLLLASLTAGCLCAGIVLGLASPAQAEDAISWDDQGIVGGIRGVDVSLWQHNQPTALDFKILKAAGVRFAFIKASDGLPKGDAPAANWWAVDSAAAAQAKLVVGPYHYAQPTADPLAIVADANAQAKLAAKRTAGPKKGRLAMALDLETAPENLTRPQLTTWAITWLRKYQRISHRIPYLYSYDYFIQTRLLPDPALTKYPLWLAAYGKQITSRPAVPGWPTAPLIWQFTSSGQIAGSGSAKIDMDVYYGTSAQLRKAAKLSRAAGRQYGLK